MVNTIYKKLDYFDKYGEQELTWFSTYPSLQFYDILQTKENPFMFWSRPTQILNNSSLEA